MVLFDSESDGMVFLFGLQILDIELRANESGRIECPKLAIDLLPCFGGLQNDLSLLNRMGKGSFD
jgi:hypothetical protein